MRPCLVVVAAEGVKCSLLTQAIPARGRGGLMLQRPVHPLVTAILSGFSWLDPLRPDSKLDQPNRERREPTRGSRSERRPVVRPNRKWHPVFVKGRAKDQARLLKVGLSQPFAANEISAEGIGNRQRIAADMILRPKPALEVSAPHLVGRSAL